jgi:hypothetical protein
MLSRMVKCMVGMADRGRWRGETRTPSSKGLCSLHDSHEGDHGEKHFVVPFQRILRVLPIWIVIDYLTRLVESGGR